MQKYIVAEEEGVAQRFYMQTVSELSISVSGIYIRRFSSHLTLFVVVYNML